MNKFKFGDRVHVAYPYWKIADEVGVVIGSSNGLNNIQFENGCYTGIVPDEFVTPASDWVKCSERLPKHGEMVLVFNGNSIEIDALAIGEFDFECWCDSVTHWMPLPAPPAEVER